MRLTTIPIEESILNHADGTLPSKGKIKNGQIQARNQQPVPLYSITTSTTEHVHNIFQAGPPLSDENRPTTNTKASEFCSKNQTVPRRKAIHHNTKTTITPRKRRRESNEPNNTEQQTKKTSSPSTPRAATRTYRITKGPTKTSSLRFS